MRAAWLEANIGLVGNEVVEGPASCAYLPLAAPCVSERLNLSLFLDFPAPNCTGFSAPNCASMYLIVGRGSGIGAFG